jgi:ADP-ribose pyrophosphatase YjhB (NUDIX family)
MSGTSTECVEDDMLIERCSAIVVRDHRVLVVRKRGSALFVAPGGRLAPHESHLDCLKRQLKAKLGVKVNVATPFGTYEKPAALDDSKVVRIHAWMTDVVGPCLPEGDIVETLWITAGTRMPMGSAFAEFVIPELARAGYIHS